MKSYLLILKMLRRYWFFLVAALVLASLISSLQGCTLLAFLPFWSKIVEGDPFVPQISVPLPGSFQAWVDSFAEKVNNTPNQQLFFLILGFVNLAMIVRGFFLFLNEVTLEFIGNSVVRKARSKLYARIQALSLDYFSEQRTGELMSRITYDAELLHQGVSDGFTRLLRNFFDLIMYIALPVILYWKLALIIFGLFVLVMPPILIIGNIIRRLSSRSQEKIADINSLLQETISGIRVVKAFSMESYEQRRFNRENNRFYRLMMSMARRGALVSPVTETVVILAASVVLIVMYKAITQHQIDAAQFLIYVACLGSIPRPLKQIGRANNKIQRSAAALERLNRILEMESTIQEKAGALVLPPFRSSVKFERITFAYNGGEPVLEEVDLEVYQGEILAIVGASGAGKSTLVNLIPRFYDPIAGRILIDGHDLKDLTLKSLRGQIGIVTQEVILFNDTVINNIAYGHKGASGTEKVEEAARMANAHDFISRFPEGYDTVIGERGYMLSGGERQRIALARAILKDPPILIFDEATSALDAESERLVQEAIARLLLHRTVFVIAHRLSTIRDADRIVVLENKKIVQVGRHDELLAMGGPYKKLYEMQFDL